MQRNSEHDQLLANVRRFPWPMHHREFVARNVLAKEGPSLVVATDTSGIGDICADYGRKVRTVRATAQYFFKVTPLDGRRCTACFVGFVDAAGKVPVRVMNKKTTSLLSIVTRAREAFQRDDEIDQEKRDALTTDLKRVEEVRKKECLLLKKM